MKAALAPGQYSIGAGGQDCIGPNSLLLFLVPAEHRLAVQQVRIMKWIMTRQPGLNLIPLIPGRAVWDAMREPLAKHFPIYLPINFANTSADSFASRLRDCVTLHFPGIFEALANPVLNNEAMPEQMQKLNTQVQVKLAELSKQVLQLEQKLAIAEKNVAVQKPATSGVPLRAAVTGSQWGGDRYLLA